MIDPLAIASLPRGERIARVELAGRVIAIDDDASGTARAVVADETGRATLVLQQGHPPVKLGAIVRALGVWHGDRLEDAALTPLTQPSRPFGAADSEWAAAQPDRLVALRIRHAIMRLTRQFFDEQGFTEVETPNVVRSPSLELHLDAVEVHRDAEPRFLHTSPEYHMKRLLSAGMSRLYQICKAHRRGELGALHQPEFTILEWYRAYADMHDMITDTEGLVFSVVTAVRGGNTELPPRGGAAVGIDVTPPWERLTVRQAFARYAERALDDVLPDADAFHRVLVEQVEPNLGRKRPTVLTHYPAALASLSRLSADDPAVAERFEVYAAGIELCNGFSELTDAAEQRKRLETDIAARARLGRPTYPVDERFLRALADGIPPSGGNALGLDRLVMLALGAERVDEIVAFPAERV